jgi:esterase
MRFSRRIGERIRELVLRLFPAATLSVNPGVGHWVHAEKPESFLRAVERFLDISNGYLPDREDFG